MATDPINRLDDLPVELLYETLYRLPFTDVENVCKSDPRYEGVCEDPIFWKGKAKFSFPELSKYIDKGLMGTYREYASFTPGEFAKSHYLALVHDQDKPVNEFLELQNIPRDNKHWTNLQPFRIEWINLKDTGKIEYMIDNGDITITIMMMFRVLNFKDDIESFMWFVNTFKDHPRTDLDELDLNDPITLLNYAIVDQEINIINYLQEKYNFVDDDYMDGIETLLDEDELELNDSTEFSNLILKIVEQNDKLISDYVYHALRRHRFEEEFINKHIDVVDVELIREAYGDVLTEDPDVQFMHKLTGLLIKLNQ